MAHKRFDSCQMRESLRPDITPYSDVKQPAPIRTGSIKESYDFNKPRHRDPVESRINIWNVVRSSLYY